MTTTLEGIVLPPTCLLLGQTAASETGDPVWLAIGFGLGVLALLLFAVEIFLPTGGMVGILCGICAVASIVSFFQYSAAAGGFSTLLYLVATPFLLVYGVKLWSQSPIGRRLILGGTETVDGEGLNDEDIESRIESERRAENRKEHALLGRIATTVTPLRPVGVIRIDDRRRDALAESGVIDEGTEVEIVEILDDQIKVRPCR